MDAKSEFRYIVVGKRSFLLYFGPDRNSRTNKTIILRLRFNYRSMWSDYVAHLRSNCERGVFRRQIVRLKVDSMDSYTTDLCPLSLITGLACGTWQFEANDDFDTVTRIYMDICMCACVRVRLYVPVCAGVLKRWTYLENWNGGFDHGLETRYRKICH